jgi:hypothetical protein
MTTGLKLQNKKPMKRSSYKYLVVLFIILICLNNSYAKEYYTTSRNPSTVMLMVVGMQAVKADLKYEDSAKFKNVYFIIGQEGVPVTCGEVNSRGDSGDYLGFQRFISTGDPELTFFEEQSINFEKLWKKFCN